MVPQLGHAPSGASHTRRAHSSPGPVWSISECMTATSVSPRPVTARRASSNGTGSPTLPCVISAPPSSTSQLKPDQTGNPTESAASTAAPLHSMSRSISSTRRSTPASASHSACLRNPSACSSGVWRFAEENPGAMSDREPATHAGSSAAASRASSASSAERRLISRARSPYPAAATCGGAVA